MPFTLASPSQISDAEMFRTLGGWMEDVCQRLEGGMLLGSDGNGDPVIAQGVGKPGFDFDFRNEPLMVLTPGTVATNDRNHFVDRFLSFARTCVSMLAAASVTSSVDLSQIAFDTDFETTVAAIATEMQTLVTELNAASGFPDVPDLPLVA